MIPRFEFRALLLALSALITNASPAPLTTSTPVAVADSPRAGDFELVTSRSVAALCVDSNDFSVVTIAADCFASDVESVTGRRPAIQSDAQGLTSQAVIIGTIGRSRVVDELVRIGKLDVSAIHGKWESFVVTTVANPFPDVTNALVIAGSDRRGTAFGVFELSEAIGVSPLVWWADVAPQPRQTLTITAGRHMRGPPSVKYRGIFINDEDWGLQPWAARTFEPETKDIGPKTYAKVCELLLRMKANHLWPAMHDCTKAFNHYPENKFVADRYAIVMGSSHCEQMLRNNVDEWDHAKFGDWNPVTNLERIRNYWEERVRENGGFENVYTIGMRGIHDGAMPGGGSLYEKRLRMERIIALQRDLLARHINPDPSRVPQIFCPYKEVLSIYQAGLKLPDDISIVWPDDNHGYVRQLPDARERGRQGGNGVYYHLSYWGRPHDYLWLDSTAPAVVWYEMKKLYEFNAREVWIANVGDIKSIETGMALFLKLAWDINRYGTDVQHAFLREFYAQQFGNEFADSIAELRDEYYCLCAIRRPEHMGFNDIYPDTPIQNSGWSHESENDEAQRFMDRWRQLARRVQALAGKLPERSRSAYFQLVEYPASAGAAMAEKILFAEKARLTGATEFAQRAAAAFKEIQELTDRYNAQGDGKWAGIMDYRPRRLPVFDLPPTTRQTNSLAAPSSTKSKGVIRVKATQFTRSQERNGVGWQRVEGLGPRGSAIVALPPKDLPTLRTPEEVRARAAMVEYTLQPERAGEFEVTIEALPTHPFTPAHELIVGVSVDDEDPVLIRFEKGADDETDPIWAQNVLRGAMGGKGSVHLPGGACKVRLWAADAGVVVQQLTFEPKTFNAGQQK